MANAWKKEKTSPLLSLRAFLLIAPVSLLLFLFLFFRSPSPTPTSLFRTPTPSAPFPSFPTPIPPFDCHSSPQASPVFASLVEGLKHPFLYSLSDFGSLPDKPHKNIARMLKRKRFRKPDISATVQEVLEGKGVKDGLVVDVGANVGMASFAAAAMGFRVLAFEPVFENLQRICEGVFFNRAEDRVAVFAAAASDRKGNITFHKLVGRLDNSAVSAVGAKLAFKSNEEIEMEVLSIPLDEVIPETEQVLLLKIDVQGWEYHVLKGASKLLSRKAGAPYLIYEEDERLLQASNSTVQQIREFLILLVIVIALSGAQMFTVSRNRSWALWHSIFSRCANLEEICTCFTTPIAMNSLYSVQTRNTFALRGWSTVKSSSSGGHFLFSGVARQSGHTIFSFHHVISFQFSQQPILMDGKNCKNALMWVACALHI